MKNRRVNFRVTDLKEESHLNVEHEFYKTILTYNFCSMKNKRTLILIIGLFLGIIFSIGFTRVYNITSTNNACESCHVHPHATQSWKQSVHYSSKSGVTTDCVDCHLPPEGDFAHFGAKTKIGIKDLWSYLTKDSADFDWQAKKNVEHARKIVYNESCEKCHANLFPSRLPDEGVAAHMYYQINSKKLDLQCVSCHLDAGHHNPNYSHSKMTKISNTQSDGELFLEPTKITEFEDFIEKIPNSSVTMSLKAIPGGEFSMGSPEDEQFRKEDEGPMRQVKLSPFFMSELEVTWDQYWAFVKETMAENRVPYDIVKAHNRGINLNAVTDVLKPSAISPTSGLHVDAVSGPTAPFGAPDQGWGSGDRPAITMSHYAAEVFCVWLSKKTGKKYRLPTEAEWEYAVRGGTKTPYFFEGSPKQYSDIGFMRQIFDADTAVINSYIIYEKNSRNKTQLPSVVQANPFGLKNMLGNVLEYCADKYDPEAYAKMSDSVVDPAPNMEGEEYVVRGGAFYDDASILRSAARGHTHNDEWIKTDPQQPKSIWWYTDIKAIGFRVVCEYDAN